MLQQLLQQLLQQMQPQMLLQKPPLKKRALSRNQAPKVVPVVVMVRCCMIEVIIVTT
jgi:hypothetical protein